jgi:molybdenum cofactor synthesis domain-containing protein
VLATGDELVAPHETPGPGQIRESNSTTILGILRAHGIPAVGLPACPDDLSSLSEACAAALDAHDLLVLSGGVSKGEHDHVKDALRACGVRLHFENLALRPGHPTTFGSRDDKAVFALPGNPVAVVATLSVVFAPGLRRWMGERAEGRRFQAELGFAHERRGNREQLLPVRLEEDLASGRRRAMRIAHHGSGDFVSLARADAFLRFPGDRSRFEAGELLEIFPFRELF